MQKNPDRIVIHLSDSVGLGILQEHYPELFKLLLENPEAKNELEKVLKEYYAKT